MKRKIKHSWLKATHRGLVIGRNTDTYRSSFGSNVMLGNNSTVLHSKIGDYSYLGNSTIISRTTIGKFCSIASDVHLGTGSHPTRQFVSTHPIFYLARPNIGWDFVSEDLREEFAPTTIGSDVWIGARAVIKDGVRIGDGAIIGAGAVVVNDLQSFGIYVGTPAKLLRYRFSDEEISQLQLLRWWDRDISWIRLNAERFTDVASLLRVT